MISSERASQEEQNGANFSSVARSGVWLYEGVFIQRNHKLARGANTHYSPQEVAITTYTAGGGMETAVQTCPLVETEHMPRVPSNSHR